MNRAEACREVIERVKSSVSGKDEVIYLVMAGMLAKGHILIDDIPGVGKTTMAKAFATAMGLENKRIQFTNDVMPSDITGFMMYDREKNAFRYYAGAVSCNLLLADEINRASSKTQSALLEVMEERKVTIEGKTRDLPEPFMVIATQNPIGSIGTTYLPESQLDRFLFCLEMGYPTEEAEVELILRKQEKRQESILSPVLNREMLIQLQQEAAEVYIHEKLVTLLVRIANRSRRHPSLALGISPRGTLAMVDGAKSVAYMEGREYVVPDDIRRIYHAATNHRVILSQKAKTQGIRVRDVLDEIFEEEAEKEA